MKRIRAIDSHTGGEPTRVVIEGGPDLGKGTVAQQLEQFRKEADHYRSAIVNEPRGSDVLVGALLCPAEDPRAKFGILFFNNVGYLGMCGHGTIGLVVTLRHLGWIDLGECWLETSVGLVKATLESENDVRIENVPSYRLKKDFVVEVPEIGVVTGDIAWGGNWFYLVTSHHPMIHREGVESLTEMAWSIRQAVNRSGHPEVDHVELFSPAGQGDLSRNFVLCPGKAYDRSPCGTGTSAKIACLASDGLLEEGQEWIQESVLGTRFVASYRWQDKEGGWILPQIRGTAHVTAELSLLLSENDPFCWGIRES